MKDETEEIRRALVPEMPAELEKAVSRGERVWSTDEFRQEFESIGFLSPFVVVRRKSDRVQGVMQFTTMQSAHKRYYFDFEPC